MCLFFISRIINLITLDIEYRFLRFEKCKQTMNI